MMIHPKVAGAISQQVALLKRFTIPSSKQESCLQQDTNIWANKKRDLLAK